MVDDTPDDLVFELHNALLWGEHPYGYSILGTRETVASLGVGELRELHARAYHPSQLVVAAAGNVEHDRLLDVLSRTGWSDVPRGDATPLVSPLPIATAPVVQQVPRDLSQTHIVFGVPAIAHNDPRRYALMLASMLLGGGMSSRLFQRVREELGLAYNVYTYQSFHVDTGVHGVYVATGPGTAPAATAAIRDELAALAATGFPADELAAGKRQLKGQVTLSMDSISARMYRAAAVELYDDAYRTVDEVLALVDAIDEETVASVTREFFDPERQTVLSLGPVVTT